MNDENEIIALLDSRTGDGNASLDEEILQELSKIPLFIDVTVPAAVFMRDVIAAVLREDNQAALDEVFMLSEEDIPDGYAESYLLLAQKICALCEYADGWVLFNKNYIHHLLDKNRIDEALKVICDLEDVLPYDSELEDFRKHTQIPRIEKLAIVGLNEHGKMLLEKVLNPPEKHRYHVICIYDYTEKNIGRKLGGAEIVSLEQLSEMQRDGRIDKIVIANSDYLDHRLSGTFKKMKDEGIVDNVFIVPPWFYDGAYDFVHYSLQPFKCGERITLNSALIKADMSKDLLDFIMLLTNLHCNNSCISCVTASPLAEPKFITLSSYQRDIKKLKELYGHICRFRISGGEPLLHPDIAEMVKITRKAFPATGLAVQTNGLLLLKDDGRLDELFNVMRENRCGFQISTYKPIYERRDKLSKILLKHGVQWHWAQISGKPLDSFWYFRMLSPVNDMEQQHATCFTDKHCHAIYDGYTYPCFMPASAEIIEKHFNVKFEGMAENMDKMRLNLHDTDLDGWEIIEFLERPTPMCKYCCFEKVRDIEWKQCPRADAKLEDYVILSEEESK